MASTDAYKELCAANPGSAVLPQVVEALAHRTSLGPTTLNLCGTSVPLQQIKHRVTDADVAVLCKLIETGSLRVNSLDLSVNQITDAGVTSLAALLASSGGASSGASVTYLNLRDNAGITQEGARALSESLLKKNMTIRTLVLDGNPLGDAGAKALADLAADHPSLTHLSLARCDVATDGVIALSSALHRAKTLVRLDLSEPRLFSRNEETASHLGRALRVNSSLRHLALRKHPHMTDTGIHALLDGLLDSPNPTLTDLDLSANRLGPPAGVYLASALERGLPIRGLKMPNCRIADEGAAHLARVLAAGATGLRDLDLRGNSIGDVGLTALAEALVSPSCPLGAVQLWGNLMEPGMDGTTALGQALLSGEVRARVDCEAYVVDGVVMLAERKLE
jgi:Ran GTPase-activating protein (RanGAP) involved in mRNA processing and transport